MIIWRGMGLAVVVVFGGLFMLIGLLFTKSHDDDAFHFAATCFATAVVWFLFLKRSEKNKLLVKEAEEQLLQPEYLDDKTRKRAELYVKNRKNLEIIDHSGLFFIHVKWWHYILAGLGVIILCGHFLW